MRRIRLHNLTLGYERRPAVHHVSGVFEEGSATALVGPNGSGKSTLLKGLCGLLPPLGGRIEFQGFEPDHIAYLPQQAEIDREFPITVADVVATGLWPRLGMFGGLSRAHQRQTHDALASVGLDGFERRTLDKLSAGQFQRVLFARLLLLDRPLVLLDEPFTALDARTTEDLLGLIERWRSEGRTIIAVLHDFEQVRAHFPQTLLLARELVAWGATGETMTPENLNRARLMSEAWSETAAVCCRADDDDKG
jgi:zinc/manganese transport system ATP-binding protein